MAKYITYELENVEDLKLSQSINQIDNECSKDFIDGSSIRGAFISKYIKDKNISDINCGEHREKLLKGGLKFLNAYPYKDFKRTIPFPQCYYADKDELKRYTKDKSINLSSEYKDNYKRVDSPKFVLFDDENAEFKNVSVEKNYSLHINKSKNNLFRYETIKKGQTFEGMIIAEDKYADECKGILSGSNIYIGGSKDSGYGKCCITNVSIEDETGEAKCFDSYKEDYDNFLYIYLLSDLIYMNKFGQYQNYIDPEYIKEKLKLNKVEFDRSFIQTEVITGYNNKWGCNVSAVSAVSAGSVLIYKYEGQADKNLIKKFEEESIGERTEDGFGRFLVLNSIPDAELSEYKEREEDTIKGPDNLADNQKQQLKTILNDIYRYKIQNKKNEVILRLEGSLKNIEAMETNQWGKLYQLCDNVEKMDIENGKKSFIDYIKHYEDKGNNKSVTYQFEAVKYNNMNLFEFIKDYINDSDNVEKFKSKREFAFKDIKVANVKPEIDENYVYRYNISVLKELFRITMKTKYTEGGGNM